MNDRPSDPRPENEPDPPDLDLGIDLSGEPEPDWAEGIRQRRRERAERLRPLLGSTDDPPPTDGEQTR